MSKTTQGSAPQQWQAYLEQLLPLGNLIGATLTPEDKQLEMESFQYLLMIISHAYPLVFNDVEHPDLRPLINNVFILGGPNPDTVYWHAPLSDQGVYKISGWRGSVLYADFQLGERLFGFAEVPGPATAAKRIDDLSIDKNGHFEFILSSTKPDDYQGNWMAMPAGTDYLIIRQVAYDWLHEEDARISIERLDKEALKTRNTVSAVDEKINSLMAFVRNQATIWPQLIGALNKKTERNNWHETPYGAVGGAKGQQYYEGLYEIGLDEVLLIETEMPSTCLYWNIQLSDQLFQTHEFMHRQSHLNGHLAKPDSDGILRFVIAHQDPLISNWLDTTGKALGHMIFRWTDASSTPKPTARLIKLANLDDHLPADVKRITATERKKRLRERLLGAQLRRRW